jgi:hypothetical protein
MSDLAMPMPEASAEAQADMPMAGEAAPQRPMSLEDDFERSQAAYEAASAAKEKLDAMQHELTQLGKKADVVTGDEVIQAAGRLIAKGLDVTQMASLLADMPSQNGQLLAEWLGSQKAEVDQAQAQFAPVYEVVKHDMGITALRLMAHNTMPGAPPAAVTPAPAKPASAPAMASPGPSAGVPASNTLAPQTLQ